MFMVHIHPLSVKCSKLTTLQNCTVIRINGQLSGNKQLLSNSFSHYFFCVFVGSQGKWVLVRLMTFFERASDQTSGVWSSPSPALPSGDTVCFKDRRCRDCLCFFSVCDSQHTSQSSKLLRFSFPLRTLCCQGFHFVLLSIHLRIPLHRSPLSICFSVLPISPIPSSPPFPLSLLHSFVILLHLRVALHFSYVHISIMSLFF